MDSKNEFIQKYQEYFVGDPSDTMDWGSDRQIWMSTLQETRNHIFDGRKNMVSLDFLNRLFLKPTPWKIRWFYPTLPISIGIESATCENSTNQTAQKARHKQETTSKHIVAMLKNIKYRCGSYAFRVIKHVDHIHIIYIYMIYKYIMCYELSTNCPQKEEDRPQWTSKNHKTIPSLQLI